MGLSTVTLQVGTPASPDVTEAVAFLIDSGAIYSIVPSAVLARLGITPLAAEQFHLADGTTITRKKGIALFRYGDRVGGADAIFGEDEDSTLLGVTTLEALGLSLDPIRRQLRPVPLVLAAVGGGSQPSPKCRSAFPPRYLPTVASGTPYLDSVARAS